MNLIDIQNKKPVINPATLAIQEFKAVWDRDKSKLKENALQEFAFLYYYSHHLSPYKSFFEEERLDRISKDVITIKNWKPDEILLKAREKYKELISTPSMALLIDAEFAVDKIRKYLRNIDVERDTEAKKLNSLVSTLKAIPDIVKGLRSLREAVESEQYEKKYAKGKRKINPRELPKNKRV